MATEEKVKHTPGNWTTHPKNGRKVICGDIDIGIAAHQKDAPQAWANAQLWAASPDPLEACQALMIHAENGGGDVYDLAVELARNAIAKATT